MSSVGAISDPKFQARKRPFKGYGNRGPEFKGLPDKEKSDPFIMATIPLSVSNKRK